MKSLVYKFIFSPFGLTAVSKALLLLFENVVQVGTAVGSVTNVSVTAIVFAVLRQADTFLTSLASWSPTSPGSGGEVWAGSDLARTEFHDQPGLYTDLSRGRTWLAC